MTKEQIIEILERVFELREGWLWIDDLKDIATEIYQTQEKERLKLLDEQYLNMQYYMEYCQMKGYVTPQDWLKKYKHF